MDSGHASSPSKPTEATKKDDVKKSRPSSFSSDSFDEDFFLLEENEQPRKSTVGAADFLQFDEHGQLVSDLSNKSPKKSPPIQVMERPGEPDPNRIPSTVFARTKSTTPVEWSVASNESLFSIHMGNNSFSKDQAILVGKSQELGRPDDMFKFPNPTTDVNNMNIPTATTHISTPTTPTSAAGSATPGTTTPSTSTLITKSSELGVTEATSETVKEVIRPNEEKTPSEGVHRSTSISHHSSGSGTSVVSFAFPILTKEGTKSGSVKVDSSVPKVKAEAEQQQTQSPEQKSQPQALPAVPAASGTKWFPCFSCSFCR